MGTPSILSPTSDLGKISYGECLEIQHSLVFLRKRNFVGNTLLFLEHDPPVYTIGRKSDPLNYQGIDAVKTERGGDVTYHSPGQLVVYPVYDTRKNGNVDVRAFVKAVENIVVTALSSCGVSTYIGKDEPGIWNSEKDRKVASVGMAIDGHVSYHGIAVNISPEPLEGFARINPCGLDPSVMGYARVERNELVKALVDGFEKTFGALRKLSKDELLAEISKRLEFAKRTGSENHMSAIRS